MPALTQGLLQSFQIGSLLQFSIAIAAAHAAPAPGPAANAVLTNYGDIAQAMFEDSLVSAKTLQTQVNAFLADPTAVQAIITSTASVQAIVNNPLAVQAIVGNWLIKQTHDITSRRIDNAAYYDAAFKTIPQIRVPERPADCKRVFHLYIVFVEQRDKLFQHCLDRGIEAKVHYPIPLYRQKGLAHLGYKAGDFPVSDRHAETIISFPCDQHLDRSQ